MIMMIIIMMFMLVLFSNEDAEEENSTEMDDVYDDTGTLYFDMTGTLEGKNITIELNGDEISLSNLKGKLDDHGKLTINKTSSGSNSAYMKNYGPQIWTSLLAHGYSKHAAAAILSCWWHESHFDPKAENTSEAEDVRGLGLAQWSGDRHTAFVKAAKKKNVSWTDYDFQMAYFYDEVENYKKLKKKSFKQATDDSCLKTFFTSYESGGNFSGTWYDYYLDRKETYPKILAAYSTLNGTLNITISVKDDKVSLSGTYNGMSISAEGDVKDGKIKGEGAWGSDITSAGRVKGIRKTGPKKNSAIYKKYYGGGYNIFANSGYYMPNCTTYAYGRFGEIMGGDPSILGVSGNAGQWWGQAKNGKCKRGQVAKPGAVVCMSNGKGYGHVGIVEQIYKDGSCLMSESKYGSNCSPVWFTTSKISYKKGKYYWCKGYTIQGFIYQPGT